MSKTIAQKNTAETLFPRRATISITEFCEALGWHRARYYRHQGSIRKLVGYGRPMIPVAELQRILEGADAGESVREEGTA
jgi:hypothetical protein